VWTKNDYWRNGNGQSSVSSFDQITIKILKRAIKKYLFAKPIVVNGWVFCLKVQRQLNQLIMVKRSSLVGDWLRATAVKLKIPRSAFSFLFFR
jgi:hypothetical protein